MTGAGSLSPEPYLVTTVAIGVDHAKNDEGRLRGLSRNMLVFSGNLERAKGFGRTAQAFDLDYDLIIVRDVHADTDSEVHDILLEKVMFQHAAIVYTEMIELALDVGD
ncbi:hypothetical protein [Telmatospirillum sp.]|uniref:hypothetical protein n=1 Tax=Telmatospirillum sp. TaxID=2079197 RepID=UPI0028522E1F|nr:hypothetical protein [Telmatospirillum sp.]MDR3435287.1 hypothetical protein [Telmatospirillum sp.]